jgi:hypothetical protein
MGPAGKNQKTGAENHFRLIGIEDKGWLYVNETFLGYINFSLGNVPNPDRIRLVVDDGRYPEGETRFEDFTIWKWHPSLHELPKEDDS